MNPPGGSVRTFKRAVLALAVVLIVAGVAVAEYSYWVDSHRSSASSISRGPLVVFQVDHPVKATGASSAIPGCPPPTAGQGEFCYVLLVSFQGVLCCDLHVTDGVQAISTADLNLSLQNSTGAPVHFVNATLFGPAERALAVLPGSGGWVAVAPTSLPVTFVAGQTLVLNIGTMPGTGDTLTAWEHPGTVLITLP
jgi:hypothetical protein